MKSLLKHSLGSTYGGLNSAVAPHSLEPGASPYMDGFVMRLNGAEASKGWEKLTSQQLTDGAASPTALKVLLLDQYFQRSGNSYPVCITNKRAYYYNSVTALWIPITPGTSVSTTVDADSASGQKVLNVTATAGFTVGDTILINEGGARQEEGVVDSISAGVSLTLLANLTYTHTGVQADAVRRTYAASVVDVNSASGQKVLSVSHTGQYTAGEEVLIGMGTAREEYGIIDTIQAGVSLTLVANLTNTHTAAQADKVYRVAEMQFTNEASEVDADVMDDEFLWTDGSNAIQKWTASGTPTFSSALGGLAVGDSVEGVGVLTASLKAKYLRGFEGFLLLGHTIEEGAACPQRVRWCQYGNNEKWVNESDGTGQAGYFTFDGPDFILRLQQLKREMFVYRERSIEGGSYMGPPDIFLWRRVETGLGLIGSSALTDLGDMHLIMGPDDTYMVDGVSAPGFGDQVRDEIFDQMNPAYKDKCQVFYMEEEGEALFIIPTGSSAKGTKAWVWSAVFKKWVGTRPVAGTAFGYWEKEATTTWDSSSGTWEEQDRAWDSRQYLSAAPLNLMGDDSGYVHLFDTVEDQDGTSWTRTYYTMLTDCGDDGSSKRVLGVRTGVRREGSGTVAVYLGKTKNEGDEVTWSDPVNLSLAGDVNGYTEFDEPGKFFQVQYRATSLCNIRTVGLEYVPEEDID